MQSTGSKFFAINLGVAALCASALPALAAPWTQPGASEGTPAGAVPPTGLYFLASANYGDGAGSSSNKVDAVAVQGFIWVPGWSFLGATYAAGAYSIESEFGFNNRSYFADVYNPEINPITLSWNLGNNFFASFGEFIYLPINTDQTFSTAGKTSGASFEQHVAVSYVSKEWVASVNGSVGLTTPDAAGIRQPDYFNLDLTLLKAYDKWTFGPVAYGSWDIETTPANNAALGGAGKGVALGVGGALGYNFGPVDLQLKATHQVDTHGDTTYSKNDTRVWTTLVIPVWTPTPSASQPLVAKY